MRVQDIATKYGAKYSTVNSIVDIFLSSGRIFSLHNKVSKTLILKTRDQSLQSQAAYKYWKTQRLQGLKLFNYRWVDQKMSTQQKNITTDSDDYNNLHEAKTKPCGLKLFFNGGSSKE